MFCKNCGNKLNQNEIFCSSCGSNTNNNFNDNKKKSKLNKLWLICAVGLIIISFIILFSGVFIGVGSGYENPDSSFDFAPFGIAFAFINGINIIFNIVMIILSKRKREVK